MIRDEFKKLSRYNKNLDGTIISQEDEFLSWYVSQDVRL